MSRLLESVTGFSKIVFDDIFPSLRKDETLFFRGHGDASWSLLPALYRPNGPIKFEDNLYKEMLLEHPADFSDDHSALEKLARMQHFMVKTRLLDLTHNPLVALYFACSSEPKKRGEIIVLSVPTDSIKYYDSDAVSIVANLAKRPWVEKMLPDSSSLENRKDRIDEFKLKVRAKRLVHEIREEKPGFENKVDPKDLGRVLCVKPKRNSKRIIAQDGAFLLFGVGNELGSPAIVPKEWILATRNRIYISPTKKALILDQLAMINITGKTLFPDIQSTAHHVCSKYDSMSKTQNND